MKRKETGVYPTAIVRRNTVITDASFCPNTRAGGWAAWVTNHKGRFKYSGCFKDLAKDSLEAELWAMLNGIWLAYEMGATHVLVQSDCIGAVLRVNDGIKEMALFSGVEIKAKHVKGHTSAKKRTEARFYVNRWCDKEAKKHMRKQRAQLTNQSNYTINGFY